MSSDRSSNSAGPGSVHEGVMDTMSPRSAASKREPETNASPVEESVEPASKHQRLVQAVQVNGDVLYTLDEQWVAYPGDGDDEHLEAQWEESDDEMDWCNLKESDGPPDLPPDQLEAVEEAAEGEEVARLVGMKVLVEKDNPPPGAWFREKAWKRRARLVCKELRIWDPNRSDVYAPSTNPAVRRVIPLLFTSKRECMRAIDVKDAFLCVPQREELYVTLGSKTYQVMYCLPGQQAASAWWGEQLVGDLKTAGLLVDIACPAVLGQESSGATVHVDDGLLGGLPSSVDAVVKVLETKYKIRVSDAVSKPGDSLKFLKKDLTVTSEGLVVSLDHKYIDRVCDLVNPKRRKIPCSQEILSDDNSPELPVEQASKFRGAIGSTVQQLEESLPGKV